MQPGRLPIDQNRIRVSGGVSDSGPEIILPLSVNADLGLDVHVTNGGSGGTASTYGASFPTIGTAVGAEYGGNMVALNEDSSGNLLVNVAAGGTAGTQYTDGGTPPTHPIGNALVWNNSGTWEAVSAAEPLPVTASLSLSNYALETGGNLATTATNTTNLTLAQGSTTSGQVGNLTLTATTTSAPTYTTAKSNPLSTDTAGNLRVSVLNTPAVTLASTTITGSVAVTGTFYQTTQPVSGTFYQTTQPVSLATNTPTLQSGSTTAVTQTTASNLLAEAYLFDYTGNGIHSTSNALNVSANITGGSIANTSFAVTNAGTFAAQAAQSGSWTVGTTSAAINVGQTTVSTSAVQVSASSTVPTNGILIGGLSANSASIFVGGSGVTTSNGVELLPGSSLPFTCNLNTLYIISAASTTDKIWYNVT